MTSLVKKAGREKMTRVLLKILINLIQNSQCVSLMIDNELVPFLEIESRKNFKNEEIKKNIIEIVNTLNSNYKVNPISNLDVITNCDIHIPLLNEISNH